MSQGNCDRLWEKLEALESERAQLRAALAEQAELRESAATEEYWHGVGVGLRAAARAVEEGRPIPSPETFE